MTNGEKYKTAEERLNKFNEWCNNNECLYCKFGGCDGRTQNGIRGCVLGWLELEYKEKLKPCPFCGGEAMERKSNGLYYVFCANCSVKTVDSKTQDAAIGAWNRRV